MILFFCHKKGDTTVSKIVISFFCHKKGDTTFSRSQNCPNLELQLPLHKSGIKVCQNYSNICFVFAGICMMIIMFMAALSLCLSIINLTVYHKPPHKPIPPKVQVKIFSTLQFFSHNNLVAQIPYRFIIQRMCSFHSCVPKNAK